jgi:hypothetical protein
MSVAIGTVKFDGLLGPGPELPRTKPILYVRPGTAHVAGRVQPIAGVESEIRVVRHLANTNRLTVANGYRTLVGTIVAFIDGSVNYTTTYSVNFLILDVTIEESRQLIKVVGIDPDGTQFDSSPGGRIVSRWRMIAVPSA